MISVINKAIADLELSSSDAREKIYKAGDAYEVYKGLKEELFDLYLSKCGPVQIRYLTRQPSVPLKVVIAKFVAKPGVQFEARSNQDS